VWWSRHYDAFISYSHKDNDVVKPLVELLSINEHKVFWDQDLKAGDRWDTAIRSSIKQSGIFVLFWCCDTSGSGYIAEEVALALRLKKKIIPVKLCAAAMPPSLSAWQWIDLRQRMQHVCADVDHQLNGTAEPEVCGAPARPTSKRWLVPVTAIAMMFLVSGLFLELRTGSAPRSALPAPSTTAEPGGPPPPRQQPIVRPKSQEPPDVRSYPPAPGSAPPLAIAAGVLVLAIAGFLLVTMIRRRRTSHTLRITMDYLHRLQRS
jgi:hypothetical protein